MIESNTFIYIMLMYSVMSFPPNISDKIQVINDDLNNSFLNFSVRK